MQACCVCFSRLPRSVCRCISSYQAESRETKDGADELGEPDPAERLRWSAIRTTPVKHPLQECRVAGPTVRVRWVNHKCKVNSDEFDREATLCL
jgi:hypothetical protein